LRFPDYEGNRMFQTLGNLAVDPLTGLLFIDWQTGTTVQISGRAEIAWGEQRLVDVAIDAVHEHERAMPAAWELLEPSRLNPPLRRRS
jgi:hypothetical protein